MQLKQKYGTIHTALTLSYDNYNKKKHETYIKYMTTSLWHVTQLIHSSSSYKLTIKYICIKT